MKIRIFVRKYDSGRAEGRFGERGKLPVGFEVMTENFTVVKRNLRHKNDEF